MIGDGKRLDDADVHKVGEGQVQGHVAAGDGGGPGAAVRLDHVAIDA